MVVELLVRPGQVGARPADPREAGVPRGRRAVTAPIEATLAEAGAGAGRVVLVEGEPGSGKTTLCRHARRRALAGGFRVVEYGGVEGEADLPMAALSALLRPLLDQVAGLPAGQRAAIATATGITDEPVADRFGLATATLGLLSAASQRAPLLVVVDDAHWLDPLSADALSFTARRLGAEPVLVLLAARPDGCPLRLPERAVRLRLGGLAAPDVRALLGDAGLPVSADVAEQLTAATGGVPRAVLETAAALSPRQRGGDEALPRPLPIGAQVTGGYHDRLGKLPAVTRHALALAALAGAAAADALRGALDQLGLTMDDLEPAEDHGVLTLGVTGARFAHPLLRAAALSSVSPATRRAIHRAWAAALSGDPEARAGHLVAAATGPDEATAAALEAAAVEVGARRGTVGAAPVLARAAALTPAGPRRPVRAIVAARALGLAGQADEARRLAAAVLGDRADPELRLEATLLLLELSRGDREDACLVTQAVELAERIAPRDPARAVRSLAHAARLVTARGSVEQARELLRPAQRLIVAGPPRGANLVLGYSLVVAGDHAGARAALDGWQLPLAPDLSDPSSPCAVQTLVRLGRLADAERLFHQLRAAWDPRGAPSAQAAVLASGSELHWWLGRWPEAHALGERAAALAERTGQPALAGHLAAANARIWAAQGKQPDCRAAAGDALTSARALGIAPLRLDALAALGLLGLGTGSAATAAGVLLEAEDTRRAWGCRDPRTAPIGPDLVEALARAGRTDEANRALAEHTELARAAEDRWALATMTRCAALLAPDPDQAKALFAAALDQHPEDVPFDTARTQLCWGEHLRRNRRITASRGLLEQALATFDRLGARPWAARAAAELRAAAQRHQSGRGPDLSALTPREMSCALAVTQGMSNREAAAALFVSAKTVECHLAKIYTKLGITSRTRLARLLTTDGLGDG